MGIQVKRVATEELREGDKITVAVTHEVKINRDSAWIRYEASSTLAQDEGTEEAKQRVIRHVTSAVIDAVHKTAEAVEAIK